MRRDSDVLRGAANHGCSRLSRRLRARPPSFSGEQRPPERRLQPGLTAPRPVTIIRMRTFVVMLLTSITLIAAVDLPAKKWLNLAAIKTMAAAAEAEARKRNVQVTLCIVDESGNLLFLQKADGAGLNTIQFAQKKARHAAIYRRPSKAAADQLKSGETQVLGFPEAFPNQGGLPIQVDGQTIGGIAASGAASEVDEAIAQAAIDALLK